jgi:hypothetical protein
MKEERRGSLISIVKYNRMSQSIIVEEEARSKEADKHR